MHDLRDRGLQTGPRQRKESFPSSLDTYDMDNVLRITPVFELAFSAIADRFDRRRKWYRQNHTGDAYPRGVVNP